MKKRRTARSLFTENLGLKVTSLLAAIALFAAVHGAEDAQRSIYVDVAASLPLSDTEMMLISQPPEQVRLTLRGSRSQINALRREDFPPIVIDLTDPNQRYYYFADDDFDIPAGLSITQLAPTSIALEWARRVERTLSVQVQLDGEPGAGHVLAHPARPTPAQVTIVGPAQQVERLRAVQTDRVTLDGLEVGIHNLRVPLMRLPPNTRHVGEASVNVHIEVVQEMAMRTITGIAVRPPEGISVVPSYVSATIEGPPGLIEMIDPASLRAHLATVPNPTSLPPGSETALELIGLPVGARLDVLEPAVVRLNEPTLEEEEL